MKGRVKIHHITGREIENAIVNAYDTGWGWSPVTVCKLTGLITNTQLKHKPQAA